MDNTYEPPDGDPKEQSRPTEQFWPLGQGPGGYPGPGYPNPGGPGPRGQDGRQAPPGGPGGPGGGGPRRRHPLAWTAGLVAAAALGAGGIVAGVALAGHSSPAASTPAAGTSAAGTAAGPGTPGAALNTALNSADASSALALTSSSGAAVSGASAGSTAAHPCAAALKTARADRQAGHPAAARAALRAAGARCRPLRHRLFRAALRRGIDGQFTFRGKGGTLRTVAFQRGIVQSASGGAVVVHAADGTTWTWDLVSSTVVRESGQKTTTSGLTTGEPVWVGGPVVSEARDARLIVIRPPSRSSASASPSPPAPSSSSSAASGS
jgi:hypothetical protein